MCLGKPRKNSASIWVPATHMENRMEFLTQHILTIICEVNQQVEDFCLSLGLFIVLAFK